MPVTARTRREVQSLPRGMIRRRTLLEWLGKGAVVALGSPLLAKCGIVPAGETDADGGSVEDSFDAAGGFPFQPGDGSQAIYRSWNVRTVDAQDLARILATWRLRVDGLVDDPFELTFAELVELPRQDQVTDFHCVEGWSVYDVPWSGVHLSRLFDRAGVQAGATHATFHTVEDEYNESLPLDVALEPKTMLGYGVAGATLPLAHGFPARLVVPRLLGYKNAKYVYRVELTDHPIDGYWVAAGYPYAGEVPSSRLRPGKY